MADALIRCSPLQGFGDAFAAMPESARACEEPFLTMVDLWVDPSGPGGAAAGAVLGVPALPSPPSTLVDGVDAQVIWLGPQEWLVLARDQTPEELETRLREVVSAHGGAAVDVSAQRTTIRLRGTHARDVLAKGCSIDLHPREFRPGEAVQTILGQAAVVLVALSDDATDYRILVRSSFARYLAAWLLDAAGEFAASPGLW
ncbi:sarcosine oxidase subunit gamma [Mycolicibacterium madagascariense]|uniref:Sarcosine oxidase subunit gamma n=1 Tax=Mycolicibacterium madagascariense TaxID=212765 RepID=A0A7I7XKK0_9MYCO|nr:sarcosine oxidase subunit gamma family protein [Mycolicibacterium madagascariense]MCV7012233.1 sarcosine oxidase subunit gamma [Mycolicibacterium madagascariense]BBZ29744.1 sarcosine oxidase subunit gamma [Mycolicibacterium madagascariense]